MKALRLATGEQKVAKPQTRNFYSDSDSDAPFIRDDFVSEEHHISKRHPPAMRWAQQSRGLQLAGAAALVAALGLVTLVLRVRRPASSELLMRVPETPQLWLGEHW